jgi:putative NADH-flavin reductase
MKLTIVAATGGVGRHLLEQAVAAGHQVTAVVRNPDRLPEWARSSTGVRVVATDMTAPDPAVLIGAVAGADAVLSGLGPRRRSEDGVTSRGTAALVAAMHTAGVRRLVMVSVAGIATLPSDGDCRPGRDPGAGWFTRTVLGPVAKARLSNHYADIAATHDLLRRSDLDWTAVGCPLLTDTPPTGTYRTACEQSVHGGWRIARADAAAFMLHTLAAPETARHCVALAY